MDKIECVADDNGGAAAEPYSCRGIFDGDAKRGSATWIVSHDVLQAPQALLHVLIWEVSLAGDSKAPDEYVHRLDHQLHLSSCTRMKAQCQPRIWPLSSHRLTSR